MKDQLSYTIEEASKITSLCRTRIYEELNQGRLHAVKVGRRTLIPRESLQKWLSSLKPYSAHTATNTNGDKK